jgi:hypothetical protein
MSQNQPSRSETAEKISVLIRIYRSAVRSGDAALRDATAIELKGYGVDTADLRTPQASKGGGSC